MSNYHQQALESAQQGDWDKSHAVIQKYNDPFSCLIHAHLHRVEGDLPNAQYWYQRAGEAMPDVSTDDELQNLVGRLVDHAD